jgi:molybdate transport system substrate-binding protein
MTARTLHILSGGAAQGLSKTCAPAFEAAHHAHIRGTFGAVGAMKAKLLEGAPCDVLILTQALIDDLIASGHARAGSARPIGVVTTGVAVKHGQPHPAVGESAQLKAVLLAASGIYFPDPKLATAGIHFMKVLQGLGIDQTVADKLRTYPNGATAMKAMADCDDPHVVGCTQVTEILITPGVDLVADLPPEYELATTYTGAITTACADPALAQAWLDALTSPAGAHTRREAGFLPV